MSDDLKKCLAEIWKLFTEDIRHNPAWGLQGSNSKWIVFYMDEKLNKTEFTFDNANEACAKMIKMTMEEIRKY